MDRQEKKGKKEGRVSEEGEVDACKLRMERRRKLRGEAKIKATNTGGLKWIQKAIKITEREREKE